MTLRKDVPTEPIWRQAVLIAHESHKELKKLAGLERRSMGVEVEYLVSQRLKELNQL